MRRVLRTSLAPGRWHSSGEAPTAARERGGDSEPEGYYPAWDWPSPTSLEGRAWAALDLADVPPVGEEGIVARSGVLTRHLEEVESRGGAQVHPTGGWSHRQGDVFGQRQVVVHLDAEGELHRLGAPAEVVYDGAGRALEAVFHERGAIHRADGPARSFRSGAHRFWVRGHLLGPNFPRAEDWEDPAVVDLLRRFSRETRSGADPAGVVDDMLLDDLLGAGTRATLGPMSAGAGARALLGWRQGVRDRDVLLALARRSAPASWLGLGPGPR